jgi:hypothetical protein
MHNFAADDVFLKVVDSIVLEALAAIGSDPAARFTLFRKLLAVAQDAAMRGKTEDSNVPASPAKMS